MGLEDMPNIRWPEPFNELDIFKVVQVYVDGKPYLRFGKEYEKHYQILEKALGEFDIIPKKEKQAFLKKTPIPNPIGERYQVAGMGSSMRSSKMVTFNGSSQDYDLSINKKHLEEIASYAESYTLIIL